MVKISSGMAKDLTKRFVPHKYNAKKTICLHGHNHDSRKEALYCVKFHQEQKEGKIRNLLMQTTYDLRVNNILVCKHIVDFDYERLVDGKWQPEVADIKGMKLPVWVIKHKMFLAIYIGVNYVVA